MRFRNIAGAFAAGALAITPLATMATATAAPTSAASADSTATGTLACSYSSFKLDYAPTITAANEGGKIKLSFTDFPGIAGVPASITVKTVQVDVEGEIAGQKVALTGSVTPATATPLSAGYKVPTAEVALPAGVKGGDLSITKVAFKLVANAFGREMNADIPCTQAAPIVISVPAPPNFNCTYSSYSLGYSTAVKGGLEAGQVNVAMDAFPGIAGVPASITVKAITAKATVEVDGKTTEITGTSTIATPAPLASGFALPAMTGAAPAGVDGGTFTVKGLSLAVTANAFGRDMNADIPCADGEALSFTVDKPKVVAPASTTSKVSSVKVAKSKKATVKVSVKAGKANAAGKAKVTIKKGKKTVATKTVTLKKGAATFVSKKLKAGKYTATVTFSGSKDFAKSASKAKKFTVKK